MFLKIIITLVMLAVIVSIVAGPMVSAALSLLAFALLFYYNTYNKAQC